MRVTQKEHINLGDFMFVLVVQEGAFGLELWSSSSKYQVCWLSIKEFQTHDFLALSFSFLHGKREVQRVGMWLKWDNVCANTCSQTNKTHTGNSPAKMPLFPSSESRLAFKEVHILYGPLSEGWGVRESAQGLVRRARRGHKTGPFGDLRSKWPMKQSSDTVAPNSEPSRW